MSAKTLITSKGVPVTINAVTNTIDDLGSTTESFASAGTATAFVQPVSSDENLRAGAEELFVTHRVYLPASTERIVNGNRIQVTDGSVTRQLEIVGIKRPGLFRSGILSFIVCDCIEDAGLRS